MIFSLPATVIFSLPFWVPSVIITLVNIILSAAIGALVTFYARFSHDNFANSIRWSRFGGVFEAGTLLWNSRQQLPTRSSIIMIIVILASLFTLVISVFLGALVSRTDKAVNTGTYDSFTEQLISADPLFWSTIMGADTTMEDTLKVLFSDNRRNPNSVPRTEYIPRTYDYDIACNETAAFFGSNVDNGFPFPREVNCMQHVILFSNASYAWDPKIAYADLIAPSTVLVVSPVIYESGDSYFEFPDLLYFGWHGSKSCLRLTGGDNLVTFGITPKEGLAMPPRTDTSVCQFASDEAISMSATYLQFAVHHLNDFDKVTASIFNDDLSHLPLLQSMSIAINNGTFLNPSNNLNPTINRTMVALVGISTNVDALVCISTLLDSQSGDMGLLCSYAMTNMITIKPQRWDPIMTTRLNRTSTPPVKPNTVISELQLTINHLPKSSGSKDTTTAFSAAHLFQATTDATKYLASLGHNVFIDTTGRTESDGLYILYDTFQLKDAFEVPTIALVTLTAVVLVCLFAVAVSEIWYPTVLVGSLYKVIYQEVKMRKDTVPMLMDSTNEPFLTFEGSRVIPEQDEQAGGIPPQDAPLLSLDKRTMHRPISQQAPSLDDIASMGHMLSTKRLLDYTPIIPHDTIATDNNNLYHTGTACQSSYVSRPNSPPLIPPRPFGNRYNTVFESSDSPSPPNQGSTLIQSPFQ